MKLLLVDDHALFREGLEMLLRHLEPSAEVLHAADVAEAIQWFSKPAPIDLVLLDLHMPGMEGLDALHALRASVESASVVVLSGTEDPQVVWRAIDAGAMGFIRKQSNSHSMAAALRVVLGGGIYLPPVCLTAAGRRGASSEAHGTPAERLHHLGISPRRFEVLARLVRGKPNKLIARDLGITEATVKSHLTAIFDALDVRSRTEAVIAVAKLGLRLRDFEGGH